MLFAASAAMQLIRFASKKKNSELSEDESRDRQDDLQKLTNKYISKIDDLLAEKEKDITTV